MALVLHSKREGGKYFSLKMGGWLLKRGWIDFKWRMSDNALTHISNKRGSWCFFLNCKRMRIKLISPGCNCFVRHFD